MQPFLSRSVRAEYAVKAAQVKTAVDVGPVLRRESFRVLVNGRQLGAHEFGRFSQRGKPGRSRRSRKRGGVKVRIEKSGSQRFFPGAFIGGRGKPRPKARRLPAHIFRREGKNRLPIERMFGPSVAQMVAESDRIEDIESFALRTLRTNLERRLSRFR